MSTLYCGDTLAADDVSLPLLGGASDNNKAVNKFRHENPRTSSLATTVFELESRNSSGGGSRIGIIDDDDSKCCPQLLRSAVAVLIAAAGTTTSILAFVYTSRDHDQLIFSIWVYIMGGLCLLNSFIMVKNEKAFLFTLPHSLKTVIELLGTQKRLKIEIKSLTEEIGILDPIAASREQAAIQLREVVDAQSSSIDEIVQLVRNNEETLDLIREIIRQKAIADVVKIVIADCDSTQVIDGVMAKSLARNIKIRMESHGIIFDEEKCLHALAMNSTTWGAISTTKRLLSPASGPLRVYGEKLDKDDIFDMFHLPNNDQRQIGSVRAARAKLAGIQASLALTTRRLPTQQMNINDAWNDSCSSSSGIPKRPTNRLREQLYQLRLILTPYFHETREGPCLFGILLFLALADSGISVYFSYIIRDLMTALAEKEAQAFYHVMIKFAISMVALIPLQVMYRFVRVKLAIAWRKWLTERVLKLYFSNKVYYGLERQSKSDGASAKDYENRTKSMDNPDQRIQEDVSSFTQFSLTFFLSIVNSTIDVVSFSIVLFSIVPELVIAIVLYASLGTLATILIGKVLIKLNYESLQREADFRFSLVRIRENCESIAFYRGEEVEKREAGRKFTRVIDNMTIINYIQRRLDFFSITYYHLSSLLPTFLLAQEYFNGLIEFGVISQASRAFWHILTDVSIVVDQFNGISAFMAGIDRLFLFLKAIQELDSHRSNEDADIMVGKSIGILENVVTTAPSGISVREYDAFEYLSPNTPLQLRPILIIRNLRLTTPDHKRVLIQNLNLSLQKGQNLLIAGVSGAGKSSLLRAIAGLWLSGDGEIVRPRDVYFLPQRPYCPPGTLRDQLLYPSTEIGNDHDSAQSTFDDWRTQGAIWSDEDLLNILTSVDLPDLALRAGDGDPVRGINTALDWSNTLSLGEQQRLAFGRLLVNRPRLIVMDESTSALDVVAERKMYTLVKESLVSQAGDPATYISVGHRPTLLSYHKLKLLIQECSGYTSFIPQEVAT